MLPWSTGATKYKTTKSTTTCNVLGPPQGKPTSCIALTESATCQCRNDTERRCGKSLHACLTSWSSKSSRHALRCTPPGAHRARNSYLPGDVPLTLQCLGAPNERIPHLPLYHFLPVFKGEKCVSIIPFSLFQCFRPTKRKEKENERKTDTKKHTQDSGGNRFCPADNSIKNEGCVCEVHIYNRWVPPPPPSPSQTPLWWVFFFFFILRLPS